MLFKDLETTDSCTVPFSMNIGFCLLRKLFSNFQDTCIQQEHGKREQCLKADHCEELRHIQLQVELDLREVCEDLTLSCCAYFEG